MQSTEARTPALNIALVVGDLVCFFVFAALGLRSHHDGVTAGGLLRAAVPFQLGWLLFSYAMGQHKRQAAGPNDVIKAWVPAWAAGLVLRSTVFGRTFAPTFALISFVVNAALLLGWRRLLAPRVLK